MILLRLTLNRGFHASKLRGNPLILVRAISHVGKQDRGSKPAHQLAKIPSFLLFFPPDYNDPNYYHLGAVSGPRRPRDEGTAVGGAAARLEGGGGAMGFLGGRPDQHVQLPSNR